MREMMMWDKYDNKYRNVVDVEVAKGLEADLYEANNRINDLLDTIKLKEEQIEYIENEYGRTIEQKDKIIDLMANDLKTPVNSKEWIIEYYKKRCENAKD